MRNLIITACFTIMPLPAMVRAESPLVSGHDTRVISTRVLFEKPASQDEYRIPGIPEYWKAFPLSEPIGKADTAPYTVIWDAPEAGTYSIMARAVNRHGISGFSRLVEIRRIGE
jgi:hypothetical protein